MNQIYLTPLRLIKKGSKSFVRELFFLIALLSFLGYSSIDAQCTMVCNDLVQVPVGDDCEIVITNDMIMEALQDCPGSKTIEVRDSLNNLIAQGIDNVSFDGSASISETLSVTMTDIATGTPCTGFIEIMDFFDPFFVDNCDNYILLPCTADTSINNISMPTVSDNCDNPVDLEYDDVVIEGECTDNFVLEIFRTWTATDISGNSTSCVQHIQLERPTVLDVVFPDDITLDCDSPNASPDITGIPTIEGQSIMNDDICGLSTTFSADTVIITEGIEYQIVRTWTVVEDCSGQIRTDIQLISVMDSGAPFITCPDPQIYSTNPGECYATITLPVPTISDNCDPNPTYTVTTSFGGIGIGPHYNVPTGLYYAEYTATDISGNTRQCTMMFSVIDDQVPTATCNDELIVSVSNDGIGVISAESVDEGSVDNCNSTLYYKVKRVVEGGCDNLNGDDSPQAGYQEWFDDDVYFCCDEVGGPQIQILLRVYEVNPGDGPIDPARHLPPDGDLYGHYNECSSMVTVQDAIGPTVLSCPSNINIDCQDDYSDLTQFGSPRFYDNCSYTVDSTSIENINDCGVGTITRIWTATDNIGIEVSCSQVITIENNHPFNENDINWPPPYTTYECGEEVDDPEDLPTQYQYPTFVTDNCSNIYMNYEDDLYTIAYPACYKILRYWTIIDWCQYDIENPQNGGIFEYTQIIKVQDNLPPVINCLDNITVAVNDDCQFGEVVMEDVTATDCYPDVEVTNNSPYADSNGANASGSYPIGTTTVTFTASDGCGNASQCTMDITVEDQSGPGIICFAGVHVELMDNNGTPMAMLPVSALDGGMQDNCSDDADIVRTIALGPTNGIVPTSTELVLGCENEGLRIVELWGTDEAGNSDFCMSFVDVQDNFNLCPDAATTAMIAGSIVTEGGEMVEEAHVMLEQNPQLATMTSDDGHFELPPIATGNSYTVMAEKDGNILNGISTLDVIKITKHILGIQPLSSPYKIIAADVNNSGSISTLDVIKLRKLILQIDTEFPNGVNSWRFIDASYTFPDPENPFTNTFPEVLNVNNLQSDEMGANFIAIKVGDVNESAIPNNLIGNSSRMAYGKFPLSVNNKEMEEGETIVVDFIARDIDKLDGGQFTLQFDPSALEFIEVSAADIESIGYNNFGVHNVENGMISMSWNKGTEDIDSDEQVMFSITFLGLASANLEDLMWLNDRMTHTEAYTSDGDLLDIELVFLEDVQVNASGNELYQNRPNPFSDDTVIPFKLSEGGDVHFSVFDLAGRLVYDFTSYYSTGYNEITVGKDKLNTKGVMYYQIETNGWKDTRKMILQ